MGSKGNWGWLREQGVAGLVWGGKGRRGGGTGGDIEW